MAGGAGAAHSSARGAVDARHAEAGVDDTIARSPSSDAAAALAAEAAAGFPATRASVLLALLRDAAAGGRGPDLDAAVAALAELPARTLVALDAAARRPGAAREFAGGVKSRRGRLRQGHPALLALFAMDENGGIREEAVVRLAAQPGRLAAAMLALRSDDWAEPVRRRARVALMWRLDPDEAAVVVPVLDLRRGKSRAEGISDVYRDAYRAAHLPARRHGPARDLAASPTPPLRRFGHELTRGLGIADDKALLRIALRDRDHACRAAAGHELLRRLRGRHRDRAALALLRVDDAGVRERAVKALPPMSDPRPLASALADRSPAVRAAARGRLVAGGTDPASAYRALLDKPPGRGLVPGLLIGLGECGREHDLAELHAHLDADEPAYRRAARAGAVALTRTWLPEDRRREV